MRPFRSVPFVLASLLLAGCGGGGGGSSAAPARGTATVSIVWPSSEARFVPLSAKSVVVTLSRGGFSASRTVVRPDSVASFDSLPYGTFTVTVSAFPTSDGTGNPQATGNSQMAVTEDVPGTTNVSLATTVASIEILPVQVDKRQSATVLVTAKDAANNVVLLSTDAGAEQVTWSTDAASVATVTGTGPSASLVGNHSGATIVRASLNLGTTTATASAPVTINAINDGTGTVTVS